MNQRTWTLTLTVPGEPERVRRVSHAELVETLRARLAGELSLPVEGQLRVSDARTDRFECGADRFERDLPQAA